MFQVEWRIIGDVSSDPDVDPISGSTLIQSDRDTADVIVNILEDDVAELDETFNLVLTGVQGGAEIDQQFNISTFVIRYLSYVCIYIYRLHVSYFPRHVSNKCVFYAYFGSTNFYYSNVFVYSNVCMVYGIVSTFVCTMLLLSTTSYRIVCQSLI